MDLLILPWNHSILPFFCHREFLLRGVLIVFCGGLAIKGRAFTYAGRRQPTLHLGDLLSRAKQPVPAKQSMVICFHRCSQLEPTFSIGMTLTPALRTLPRCGEGFKKNSLAAVLSGPREIRTLDLLNAIETRSQLRYGPLFTLSQLYSMALLTPPGRGLRALWAPVYSFSIVSHGAPNSPGKGTSCAMGPCVLKIVDLEGFEPSTSSVRLKRAPNCATGPYSIQISRFNILTV